LSKLAGHLTEKGDNAVGEVFGKETTLILGSKMPSMTSGHNVMLLVVVISLMKQADSLSASLCDFASVGTPFETRIRYRLSCLRHFHGFPQFFGANSKFKVALCFNLAPRHEGTWRAQV
jgi:hypothetical protein